MKKVYFLFVALLLSAVVMVSSCKKTDAVDDEVDPGLSIHLKEGAGYISDYEIVIANTVRTVGIIGRKCPVSGYKLTRFKLSVFSEYIQTTLIDSTFSSDSIEWETNWPTLNLGPVNLLFELWDEDGVRIEKSCEFQILDISQINHPVLIFKQESGYTYMDTTIRMNTSIKFGVTGRKNIISSEELNRFKFSVILNNITTTITDSTFSADSFDWDKEITFTEAGIARLLFELTDDNGRRNERSFELVIEDPGTAINKYVDVEFGSWNDVEGSFFSSTEGINYNVAQTNKKTPNTKHKTTKNKEQRTMERFLLHFSPD